jgi:hypothetical protein
MLLTDFQCYESDGGQKDADDPEPDYDLRFGHGPERLLQYRVNSGVARFLEMVVER